MQTRITATFGVTHPIVLSGMSWISTPPLVAAVAEAGGLGILATGVCRPAESRELIRTTRQLTEKPFGANVTLYFPSARENAEVLIAEQVPIVNYALGKGDWICQAVHAYGGKVIATVATLKHALKAEEDGADALIVTGHEAAGHGGDVTSLVLAPRLAERVRIPIILAGGIADGRGLAAALCLGAEGVAMGTRFMCSVESPVHELQKAQGLEAEIDGTVYTDRVDGLPARVLRSPGSTRLMRRHLDPLSALWQSRRIARLLDLPWAKVFFGVLASGPRQAARMARLAIGFTAFETGTQAGDNERGVLPLGQAAGLIHDRPTVREIIERTVAEAEAASRRVQTLVSAPTE